jgi:hypothetical protein
MIDELAKMVSHRTGLSPELSQVAVQLVLEQVKSRVPGPLAQHLELLIRPGQLAQSPAHAVGDGVMGALGGLFK